MPPVTPAPSKSIPLDPSKSISDTITIPAHLLSDTIMPPVTPAPSKSIPLDPSKSISDTITIPAHLLPDTIMTTPSKSIHRATIRRDWYQPHLCISRSTRSKDWGEY